MQVFIVLSLLISIGIVLFALQNSAIATVSFLSFHYEGSLALILVMVFTLGLVAGLLISIPSLLRKGSDLREQKKKLKQLEESIAKRTVSDPAGWEKADK